MYLTPACIYMPVTFFNSTLTHTHAHTHTHTQAFTYTCVHTCARCTHKPHALNTHISTPILGLTVNTHMLMYLSTNT